MSDNNQRQQKKINVDQVVSYLNHAFGKAQQNAIRATGPKNQRGTKLHQYQVDFCYLINDIQRGPRYIVPKTITRANELIEKLDNETAWWVGG